YFLSLTLLLLAGTSLAQNSWRADRYDGIPTHDKANILFEDFLTDGGAFPVNRSAVERQEKVYDGEFYIISYGHKPVYKLYEQPIDAKDDYEIEMNFRFGEGFSYTMAGMAFGGDQRNSHFRFITDVYGNYEISIHHRGVDKILNSGQTRRRYSADEARTLSLRQVKDQWYFFISQELVYQTSQMDFFGDRLGFRLGGTRTMKVDYFRVSRLQSSDILGPIISLSQPVMTSGNLAIVNEKRAYISGRLTDQSGVEGLTINNQPITVDAQGNFQASLRLPEDKRVAIKMEATDVYGNPTHRDFYFEYKDQPVAYQPPAQTETQAATTYPSGYAQNQTQTPTRPRQVPNRPANTDLPNMRGENYLLVIGVNNYRHWSYLNNAVKDCHDIVRTLTQFYMFEPQNVHTLFNEEASRENILEKLEELNAQIGPDDNLLVYYAGHGFYNNSTELGYWVPYDARKDKVSDFIPNSTVRDYVRQIDAHNTFLIADACYSGSMFGSRGNSFSRDARSRWAFTSGDIEKVWDGQPGQNSPFARYLISYLKSNTKTELPAYELIEAVSNQVRNNTQQKPQGAPLRLADDQGGVFIFYRR
ncbi:MAG: caspase family protein, partial [Bacteroidota bacterium]